MTINVSIQNECNNLSHNSQVCNFEKKKFVCKSLIRLLQWIMKHLSHENSACIIKTRDYPIH